MAKVLGILIMLGMWFALQGVAEAGKTFQECGGTDTECGSVVVINENCDSIGGKHVNVEVDNDGEVMCNQFNTGWTGNLGHGDSKKIRLVGWIDGEAGGRPHVCLYSHQAEGTAFGPEDVKGNEDSTVNCTKDWIGVCQCKKQ